MTHRISPFRVLLTLLILLSLLPSVTPWCLKTTVNLTTSVDKVDFAPDGTYLAVTSASANTVTVYDTINYFKVLTYTPGGATANVARFNRNSSILAVGLSTGFVVLLSGKAPFSTTPITTFQPHNKQTIDLDFSTNDDKLLTC
jgi:WD40 repeat protein